jgi:hypothetical protein
MKRVQYAVLNEDRTLHYTGNTDEFAFADMKANLGDLVVEIQDPAAYSSGDTIDPSGAIVAKGAPIEAPTPPEPTLGQQRAAAYPNLGEFADALYWRERGQPERWEAWLATCDNVKKTLPKPDQENPQ